jgi:hypothetical protein
VRKTGQIRFRDTVYQFSHMEQSKPLTAVSLPGTAYNCPVCKWAKKKIPCSEVANN